MSNHAGAYKMVDTLGKTQIDLILQVYDGVIAELTSARALYEQQQYIKGYKHLERAERFVTHLYTTLDPESGGEIARNLGKLYAWVIGKLHEVQATKERARFDECLKIMENLRAGWVAIKAGSTQTAPSADTAATAGQLQVVG